MDIYVEYQYINVKKQADARPACNLLLVFAFSHIHQAYFTTLANNNPAVKNILYGLHKLFVSELS